MRRCPRMSARMRSTCTMRSLRILSVALGMAALGACSESTPATTGASTTSTAAGTGSTVAGATTTVAGDSVPVATDGATTTVGGPTTTAPAPASTPAPPPATVACHAVGEFPANFYELNFSLRRGDCGPAVETLQTWLRDVYDFAIAVDGQFGPATEAAVRDLEVRFFGSGDGVLDRDTWTIMTGSDADFVEA